MALDPSAMGIAEIVDSYPDSDVIVLGGRDYIRVTSMSAPATASDIDNAWRGAQIPAEVRRLWSAGREMLLLYREGGEGLRICSPNDSFRATMRLVEDDEIDEDYFHVDDILVGEFQGYDQLLIYSPENGWLVAGPIDIRDDWLRLGPRIEAFLIEFLAAGGTEGPWEKPFLGRAL